MCVLLFVYLFLTFKKLENSQLNSVDNIILLLKDNNIVDGLNVTEEMARKLFDDVADVTHVKLSKFESVLTKLVHNQTKSVDELVNMVSKSNIYEGSSFLDTLAYIAGYTDKKN